MRTGVDGKLHVTQAGLIPYPTDPDLDPALVPGFWLGLAMLQTLFTLEHNSICDHLKSRSTRPSPTTTCSSTPG